MNSIDLQHFSANPAGLPRSTALLRENGLRVLLLHLAPGEQIPEHQTRGALTVQCLSGQVSFFREEECVELTPGILISLPPGAKHRLTSSQDSLLLVSIAEQPAA